MLYWCRVGLLEYSSGAPLVGKELIHKCSALARTDVKFKTWLCGVTILFTQHCRKRQANAKKKKILFANAKSDIKR